MKHRQSSKTAQQPSIHETPDSYSQEVRKGTPIPRASWTYPLQSSCYNHTRSGSCATCPESNTEKRLKYIWPTNHHSSRRPPYSFHQSSPHPTLGSGIAAKGDIPHPRLLLSTVLLCVCSGYILNYIISQVLWCHQGYPHPELHMNKYPI